MEAAGGEANTGVFRGGLNRILDIVPQVIYFSTNSIFIFGKELTFMHFIIGRAFTTSVPSSLGAPVMCREFLAFTRNINQL